MATPGRVPERIRVSYSRAGETHVFTSPDLRGLHVGHAVLENAFDMVPRCVSGLIRLTYDVETEYAPEITFDEFLMHLKEEEEYLLRPV